MQYANANDHLARFGGLQLDLRAVAVAEAEPYGLDPSDNGDLIG
jgi:hypothetical protein